MSSYRLNWYECQNLIDNLFQFLKVLLSSHESVEFCIQIFMFLSKVFFPTASTYSLYRSYENCRRPGVAILDMQMSKVPIISGYEFPLYWNVLNRLSKMSYCKCIEYFFLIATLKHARYFQFGLWAQYISRRRS